MPTYVRTQCHPQNRKKVHSTVVRRGLTTATGNKHRKLSNSGHVVFSRIVSTYTATITLVFGRPPLFRH